MPDSSAKTMKAPRRLAFFYPGPALLHPGGDRLVVSLDGLAGGALTAPAKRAQHLPDVAPVIGDPGRGLDDRSHPIERPQVGGVAIGTRPLAERFLHPLELSGRQPGTAAPLAGRGKAVGPTLDLLPLEFLFGQDPFVSELDLGVDLG